MKKKQSIECDSFFDDMNSLRLALEFDDVTIKTRETDVMPTDVNVETKFSRNVGLKSAIVSAAMDTVTESRLAIALAKLGGIGVIHRNLTPDEQAIQVRQVKRHLNGLIERPITVKADETIESILARRAERGYTFDKFPVIENGYLVGIITKDDLEFYDNVSKTAAQVMTTELVTAGPNTTLREAYDTMRSRKKKALPLVNERNELVGMYDFSDVKRLVSGGNTSFNLDAHGRLRVAAAVGVLKEAYDHIAQFPNDIDAIVIDTAHGDSKNVFDTVRSLKKDGGVTFDIVVGNVTEPESVKRLLDLGIDGIKVGQGPGSICTTRIVAGVGCPQLTAIHNCARMVRGTDVPIIADGGICESGDIPKAIVAGADSVMIGRLFAGCEEAPGETFAHHSGRMKKYRGMGSLGAMQSRGGRERYGQGEVPHEKLVPEGIEGAVPYRGMLADVVHQLLGGLRSSMAYVGAHTIPDLQQRGNFHRVTQNGVNTSHPHDVMMVADAPNYRR